MRVWWVNDQDSLEGGAIGYSRANRALRAAGIAAGLIDDHAAPIALHFTWAGFFQPIPGRINVLLTMYESEDLHPCLPAAFAKADAVCVPSTWCADVFKRYTDRPVYVCPLGVDTTTFYGVDREWPGPSRPFTWLWVGAHNLRKGFREVQKAWITGEFVNRDDMALYLKTVEPRNDIVQTAKNAWVDSRLITDEALMHLYCEADGFVFPSHGEGWGFPLLEAMATALPCVTTLHTGMMEFADSSVCSGLDTEPYIVAMDQEGYKPHFETIHKATVESLVARMRWVMDHWTRAKRMGKRACDRAQSYTWDAAGVRLVAALESIAARHGIVDADRRVESNAISR